jgi:S1-C subfamily serine protease
MSLRVPLVVAALVATIAAAATHASEITATIERVKSSIVAIGTYQRTRTPPFDFHGTGFVVGDGTLIATNAHVLPGVLDPSRGETIAIVLPAPAKDGKPQVQVREAHQIAVDTNVDIALLRITGPALPSLKLADSDKVREGEQVLFTGFPIGAIIGLYPATHRGMVSAITPIAIPQPRASELDASTVRRLSSGAFPVFQLDATAYPGNSGSPLYDAQTGEVIGIVNMVFVKSTKEAALTQPSGITYAVPSRHLRDLLEKAR